MSNAVANMNDNFRIFSSPEFCDIRTTIINCLPWFVGKDVATALDYSNPQEAIRDHVDIEDKIIGEQNAHQYIIDSLGRKKYPTLINESGVYSLIFSSRMKKAKEFKHWVTSEVLPAIRTSGTYSVVNKQNANNTLPLSREEMAMYIAAIQSHTEEIKDMCVSTFTEIGKIIQKNSEDNVKNLSMISDTASKLYSSYALNSAKIVECLNNIKISTPQSQSQKDEEEFLKSARSLLSNICRTYNIEQKMAYSLVYGEMVKNDGINPYKYKVDSSVIKGIAKNPEFRASFIKCAENLCCKSNDSKIDTSLEDPLENSPENSLEISPHNSEVNKQEETQATSPKKRFYANNPLWSTPEEIRNYIAAYQKKYNKKSYEYASQCVLRDVAEKAEIGSIKNLRKLATEYGNSLGHKCCSISYYIYNNERLFNILKSLVEEEM